MFSCVQQRISSHFKVGGSLNKKPKRGFVYTDINNQDTSKCISTPDSYARWGTEHGDNSRSDPTGNRPQLLASLQRWSLQAGWYTSSPAASNRTLSLHVETHRGLCLRRWCWAAEEGTSASLPGCQRAHAGHRTTESDQDLFHEDNQSHDGFTLCVCYYRARHDNKEGFIIRIFKSLHAVSAAATRGFSEPPKQR